MKAIIFCLSFVLALFHPTYSSALESRYANNFEIVQQKSICLFPDLQSEDQYFDIDLLEDEDNDEVNSSPNLKFSSKKKSFTTTNFSIDNDCTIVFFKRIWSNRYFFQLHPAYFISLRVLRL